VCGTVVGGGFGFVVVVVVGFVVVVVVVDATVELAVVVLDASAFVALEEDPHPAIKNNAHVATTARLRQPMLPRMSPPVAPGNNWKEYLPGAMTSRQAGRLVFAQGAAVRYLHPGASASSPVQSPASTVDGLALPHTTQ
jgi:hypothetical protein